MDIDEDTMNSNDQIQANVNSIFAAVTGEHDPLSPSNSNSASTFSASRGRSKVWNEFYVAPDGKKVVCRLCGDSLSYSNSHSTSSMLKHLKRKHRMDLYPTTEEDPGRSNLGSKTPEKAKKSNKVKRVTTITNPCDVEPEPSIQHGPLVFTEACVRMRWTDHTDAFLGTFSRLYSDESYTDVTLVAEKIFFKAHRVILSSASEYFDDMFKMTPQGQHPIIFMKDVKAMDLRILLDFIYKGEIAIPPSLINELVRIGTEMKVRGLCDFQWSESMKSSVLNISQPGNVQVPSSMNQQEEQVPLVQHSHPASCLDPIQTQPISQFSTLYNTFTPSSVTSLAPVGATMASELISPTRTFLKQTQGINSPVVTKTLSLQPVSTNPKTFARITTVRPAMGTMTSQVSSGMPNVASIGSTSTSVPALKRIRILASTAAPNKVVGTTRYDIGATGSSDATDLDGDGETVLMVTNEGETVLSTSQGAVTVVPHSDSLAAQTKQELDPHTQHLDAHPITLVSHHLGGTTDDLDEVVYSITTSVGPHGEVLMSNTDEGEVPETETIVVYGTGEDLHSPSDCEADKKPIL